MINANREQDLLVYVLSPKGQAEITNYRTVKIPSNTNIPLFVKNEFGKFYKSLFQTSYRKEDRQVAFVEYAWNMSNCDPCSADPFTGEIKCQSGREYQRSLRRRYEKEAQTLSQLTNWNINDIRQKMKLTLSNIPNS